MTILKLGSKGLDVKCLQQKLNLIPDGIFGSITEEAAKNFQKQNKILSDGIVGPTTWAKLRDNSRKITEIILHCSATPEGKDYTVEDIKKWHLARGFSDIGYHYIIYRDGTIVPGRDENIVGAHCTGRNSNSIGICYIGGLDKNGKTAKDTRTNAQKKALVTLVKQLMLKYGITEKYVFGHYQFANKACPSFKIETFKKEL